MRRTLLAAALLVLALPALPARAHADAAAAPPLVGRIAFARDNLVHVVASDGSAVTTLDPGRRGHEPYTLAWSRDGTRIADARWYVGAHGDLHVGIDVFDVATGDKSVVWGERGTPIAPAFSPDGRRLAYVELPGDGATVTTAAVGGCCRRPVVTGDDVYETEFRPAWSPDGRFLYVVREHPDRTPWLQRVRVTGEPGRAIAPGFAPTEVVVAPVGGRLAMCGSDGTTTGVFVAGLDGRHLRPVATLSCDEGAMDGMAWSPDGRSLAVLSGGDVVRVDVATATATRLVSGAANGRTVSWSPDGGWVAFTGDAGGAWVVGADGIGLAMVPGTEGGSEVLFAPTP